MERRGLFITGTDTGVGKTKVTAGMAGALLRRPALLGADPGRDGLCSARPVRVWKPVQTGVASPDECDADSFRLAFESGLPQGASEVASLTFADPLAPWMAARRAGRPLDYGALLAEGCRRLEAEARDGFLLVEGAGGLAVPLTETKLVADLAAALGLPALIVARPGLGTVNHTLLTVAFARQCGIRVAGVILNESAAGGADRFQVEENAEMIETFGRVPVVGKLPFVPHAETELTDGREPAGSTWIDTVLAELDWNELLS